MDGAGTTRAARVVVDGYVQGVFFRDSCRRLARQSGVSGWVRNLPDGRVEAWFEGPAPAVGALVEWCREGPPGAHVGDVEVHHEEPAGVTEFRVR